jgi:hypothetical protein
VKIADYVDYLRLYAFIPQNILLRQNSNKDCLYSTTNFEFFDVAQSFNSTQDGELACGELVEPVEPGW